MVIVLLHQEDVLLRKHIEKQIARFVDGGGFRESLSKARSEKKRKKASLAGYAIRPLVYLIYIQSRVFSNAISGYCIHPLQSLPH